MSEPMVSALLVGSTGLVGSNILSTLCALPSIKVVHALARRQPTSPDQKLDAIIEPESSKWPSRISAIQPTPSVFFSALGTTKALAGGVDKQREIDYDLNLALAKTAKEAGINTYVLISVVGATPGASNAYSRMKGDLEEAVKKLEFPHLVILRPGLIVGSRKDSRPPEAFARGVATLLGGISGGWLKDPWAQDADVIAKAAVASGLNAVEEETPKVRELGGHDIIRLGRTEWKS